MSQLIEYIRLALMNIRSNKLRTFLTMLGIIIGVSSVILIVSIGAGVQNEVNGSLNDIAGGQLYIMSNKNSDDNSYIEFTKEDFDFLTEKVEGVIGVTEVQYYYGEIATKKGSFEAYADIGTEAMEYYYKDPLLHGRYFTKDENDSSAKVCILKAKDAITLFGTDDVVGQMVEISFWGEVCELKVIGVRKDNPSKMYDMLAGSGVIEFEMPCNTFDNEIYGMSDPYYTGMYVMTDMSYDSSLIASQCISILEARHNCRGEKRIDMEDFNSYMDEINSILDIVKIFVVFVAMLSLFVGGIGVMTIMLVSVNERTREIGIRKSLGARTGSILIQFLCESAIITLVAGIIGIIIGAVNSKLVGIFLPITPVISISTVIIASAFSTCIGLFFGIYPAKKAAKLSPIEALRHE